MYSTFTSCPSATALIPISSTSHQNTFFNFSPFIPSRHHRQHRHQICKTFSVKSSHKPLNPLRIPSIAGSIQFPLSSRNSKPSYANKDQTPLFVYNDENLLNRIAKPLVFALFWIVIGLCPIRGFHVPAIAAAPVASEVIQRTKTKGKGEESNSKGHEYSDCTRRLLETVSKLLRAIEEVSSGNGDVKNVEMALKEVKLKKEELQEEIMSGLYVELRVLRGEKEVLINRSDAILATVMKAKREQERLLSKASGEENEEAKERTAKLEEEMSRGEKEYNGIWEKIGEIEDKISRREYMALSIGVRELSFIQRESELLVESFRRKMRRKNIDRSLDKRKK